MIVKWAIRGFLGLISVLVVALIGIIVLQDATPFTPTEMKQRASALFAYGSVEVPHDMAKQDHPHQQLFSTVQSGAALSAEASQTYRTAFQSVLAENQGLFRALDNNLVFATDHAMETANSISGSGIAGTHDLHAASARSNFYELSNSLDQLSTVGSVRRILLANKAYKSLTDLMVHLAPAVHSVVVDEMMELPGPANQLTQTFDEFRSAFHRASFAPINSATYWQEIEIGVAAYASLATQVQTQVVSHLSPFEHQMSGRWLAFQSVSPQLSIP